MPPSAASSSEGDDMPAIAEPSDEGSDSEVGNDDDSGNVEVQDEEEGEEEEEEEEGEEKVEEVVEEEEEGEEEEEVEEEEVEEEEEEEEAEAEDDDGDDGKKEAEDGSGEEKTVDLPDLPTAADGGQNDSSQEIKPEGQDEDSRPGSSTPDKSEPNLSADSHDVEDPQNLLLITDIGDLPEKKAPIDVQKDYGEAHNGSGAHLNNINSVGVHDTKSLYVNENLVVAETPMRNGSSNKESNGDLHSEEEAKQMDMLGGEEDLKGRASRLPTTQLGTRRLSPGAEFVDRNKRPAIICDFFAKGWCIKGNSCRFLHQKDGVDKGDMAVASDISKLQVDAGLRPDTETSRLSVFPEALVSSVANNSSERVLTWEHGESHRWNRYNEEHRLSLLQRGDPSSGILQDESEPISIVHCDLQQFSVTGDDPGSIPSLKGVGMENLRQNLPPDDFSRYALPVVQGDFPNFDTPGRGLPANHSGKWKSSLREENSHKPPLDCGSIVPDYRFLPSGSIVSSSIYRSSGNPSVYDRSIKESASLKQPNQFMLYDHTSSVFSSLKSNSNTSLPSIGVSPSHHALAWSGGLSSHVSPSLSALDGDRVYNASRSASLPRSSSPPFYSRSEPENLSLHGVSMDPLVSAGIKTPSNANAWEPSKPFRPSFYLAGANISSPGSQYDPLLDSIEPPNGGDRSFKASFSQGMTIQHTSHQQTQGSTPKEEMPLGPSHVVDVANSNEMDLDRNLRHQTDGGREKEESKAGWGRHNKEMDLRRNTIHKKDGDGNKESKSLKLFRAGLVDFVKELVKPFWREGHLSKDAHKTIVKKAVEKVLSTLQPHQVPSTMESINQYLSSSRPKIAKLVEGYVDKYGKSSAASG